MDNYKLKFENGRNYTIQADNVISFQDKINDAENRFDSECVSINDKPIKKHSLGGFLVGATIGAIVGNSVPAHSVSKTTKGVKQTAKKVTRTVKKQVKKFEGGGKAGQKYKVFNYSDNLFATDETFKTKALANAFIKEFRKRYIKQGYYRDNNMRKIKPEDIDLLAIPSDFNPFKKFGAGGMSSMGMPPQVAIANEISNKLPATTSAIDKRLAERIYSDKPSMWEDRGLRYSGGGGLKTNKMLSNEQIADFLLSDIRAYKENIREILIGRLMDSSNAKIYWDAWFRGAEGKDLEDADKGIVYKKFSGGGKLGDEIVFDRWGEHTTGTITETMSNGNFSVSSGMGSYLVEPKQVISISPRSEKVKKGWFFAQGGSTNSGLSWYQDHARHNSAESYERPMSERKKFDGGGGVGYKIGDMVFIPSTNQKGEIVNFGSNWVTILLSHSKERKVFDFNEIEKFAGGGGVSKDVIIKSFFKNFGFNVEDIQPDEYGNGIEGWIVFYDNKNKYRVIDYSTAKYLMVHDKTTNKTDIIKQSKSFNIDSFNK